MEAEPLMLRYEQLNLDSSEMKKVGSYVPKQVLKILQNIGAQNGGVISKFSMLVTQKGPLYVKVGGNDILLKESKVVPFDNVA